MQTSTTDRTPPTHQRHALGAHPLKSGRTDMADPHGLIASYLRIGPPYGMVPRELFVLWLLSLRREDDAAMAAEAAVEAFGDALTDARTAWHSEFLSLLSEAATWPKAQLRRISQRVETPSMP